MKIRIRPVLLKPFTLFFLVISFYSCSNKFDGKNGVKTVMFPGTDQVCQTIEYKDGKKNGTLKEYFENGNLKTVQQFKDGVNVDSALYYHMNGKLAVVQMHKNGEKTGCWRKYNEAGKLYSEMCFKNDLLDGTVTTYTYKTLRLIERFNYKEGSKHGKQETFYNSGKPKSVVYYNNDQLCLGTKEWLENGDTVNNDFDIKVVEQNKVNLENRLYFYITLQNPQEGDEVWQVLEKDSANIITRYRNLIKEGDRFVLEFSVNPGGFVMEKIKLAAYRQSRLGTPIVKIVKFNAAANNF